MTETKTHRLFNNAPIFFLRVYYHDINTSRNSFTSITSTTIIINPNSTNQYMDYTSFLLLLLLLTNLYLLTYLLTYLGVLHLSCFSGVPWVKMLWGENVHLDEIFRFVKKKFRLWHFLKCRKKFSPTTPPSSLVFPA